MKRKTKRQRVRKAKAARPAAWCDTRVCVPAPMPVLCPKCKCSETAAANGVHYRRGSRYEHRICGACGFAFIAMRSMTAWERQVRGLPPAPDGQPIG